MAGTAIHSGLVVNDIAEGPLKSFCQQHGIASPFSAERIRAGRNSEVRKISNQEGRWILKNYYQHGSDPRDRLGTEFAFLTWLKSSGASVVARPLGMDRGMNCALYTFLPGTRPSSIASTHISQAVHFIRTINLARNFPDALALPMAADACLSWRDHVDLAASRIDRLLLVKPEGELALEVHEFVKTQLWPLWMHLRANLISPPEPSQARAQLPLGERVISPSDFGFHNALENQGELSFVDFEYAGWDDPAKLICDFICQPEVPVTHSQGRQFMEELLSDLPRPDRLRHRVEQLLPVHRLKWCCILLNEFRVEDQKRRLHAGVGSDGLLEDQLGKAKSYFNTHLAH